MDMRLWLNGVEITAVRAPEVPIRAYVPEGPWRAACTNPPAKWLREHPDLAAVEAMLDGFYG